MEYIRKHAGKAAIGFMFGKAFQLAASFVVATIVGVFSGLEAPWNYTLAAALGFAVLGVLVRAGEQLKPRLPQPWNDYDAFAGSSAGLDRLVTRHDVTTADGPEAAKAMPELHFGLRGVKNRSIDVPSRIRALEFIRPVRQEVKATDLPMPVRWRFKKIMVIKRFDEKSILLDELTQGFDVAAEIYYDEDAAL